MHYSPSSIHVKKPPPMGGDDVKMEIKEMKDRFYRALRNRGYSVAYCKSLSQDYTYMARHADSLMPSADDMLQLYNDMEKRELSPTRLGNIVKMFKHWARFARIDPPDIKPPRDSTKRIVYLTELEAKQLLYACESFRDHALLCTLLYTGMRRAEVSNLTWENVDFKTDTMTVHSTKTHLIHEVPVSEKCITSLKRWKDRCKTERVFAFSPDGVGRIVKDCAARAKIEKNVTPHVLRHTLATKLILNGADISIVQRQLGHRDIKSTRIPI